MTGNNVSRNASEKRISNSLLKYKEHRKDDLMKIFFGAFPDGGHTCPRQTPASLS
jgi:hypothetical protein